jgi:UDP-glucose 4-epimerase
MKILVTGGAGFIGSHLVDSLLKEGHQVLVFDNLSSGKEENLNPRAKFYKVDLLKDDLESILQKERPTIIYHFAAQINLRRSLDNPLFDAEENILGSLHLFESALKNGARYFLFASSGGAMFLKGPFPSREADYPSPFSPYGNAKLAVENYLLNYYQSVCGVKTAILRFANVYGPRQDPLGEAGVVAIFCHRLLNHQPLVIFGDGRQTRDFVYIDDIARACLLCLKKKAQGIFHLGTGEETTINRIAKYLIEISGEKAIVQHGPKVLGEARRSCLNSQLAWRTFGWRAEIKIKEGLKRTWEWFKNKNSMMMPGKK